MTDTTYFWTALQKAILQTSYESGGGLSEAERRLPEKRRGAIAVQASRMKLTTPKPRKSPISP